MSSFYNNLSNHDPTQGSANMFDLPTTQITDLPSSVQSVTGNKTDVEAHLKIIEIKKQRLKALTALAKSQTILAEIDIAIAEYELKLELDKQRRSKPHHGSRKSKDSQQSHKASKKMQASEIKTGSEQPKSPKNKISHQNSRKDTLKSPKKASKMKDASLKPQEMSEKYSSDKKNTKSDPKVESIMCSIPFNKIIHLQNVSPIGKHIISTYLSQQQNIDTQNTESNSTADVSNIPTSNPKEQSASDQNANACSENTLVDVPCQQDLLPLATQYAGIPNVTFKSKKHICMSMLRVTHRYNFSIIPQCVIPNQSDFSCVEGDHIGSRNQFVDSNQKAALNSNRLLTICSDSDHPGDDRDQFSSLENNMGAGCTI